MLLSRVILHKCFTSVVEEPRVIEFPMRFSPMIPSKWRVIGRLIIGSPSFGRCQKVIVLAHILAILGNGMKTGLMGQKCLLVL